MADPVRGDDIATYEVVLRGEIPPSMRARLSKLRLESSPTRTVLYREVTDLAELDLLLDQLQSVGLVLSGLEESPPRRSSSAVRGHEGASNE